MNPRAWNLPESVISCYVALFLAAIDDESIEIFCRSVLPCLCADLISPDRILFQMPFCRSSRNRRCAAGFEPHLSGMSARLHPVANANKAPLVVVPSSHLGRPVLAGSGDCGAIVVLHWASEISL